MKELCFKQPNETRGPGTRVWDMLTIKYPVTFFKDNFGMGCGGPDHIAAHQTARGLFWGLRLGFAAVCGGVGGASVWLARPVPFL